MSNLHALFALRNEQGFTRALDALRSQSSYQQLSSSGGRSWPKSHFPTVDINALDGLGRTVLHLACAKPEPFALAYVRLLLSHPAINVNIQDAESRWTALHRALYAGNIAAVILLLQRQDTDIYLRDYDGYTPFDLYNSTVDGTAPDRKPPAADLFTWGVNRNANLGHGDASDRTFPDQVSIQSPSAPTIKTGERFAPIQFDFVTMAKFHTAVITDEPRGNLRMCGSGAGGRLGTGQYTQYSLQPVPQLTAHIVIVALGQDHTLALSNNGEVFSWGLNRFSQLGYSTERDDPQKTVFRRVLGPLRKEHVIGVAACRSASACWTTSTVYTWGTNNGQLGYDHVVQPVQVLPRKVTSVQDVVQIALTDSAMACLLQSKDVIFFRSDAHYRVKFSTPDLTDFKQYQHPHVVKSSIAKITTTDGQFAALSSRGDIFTFTVPPPPSEDDPRPIVKTQRVWSLHKSFDPAKDLALGADGALIVCTASGHVFFRSRPGAKAIRVPHLHRIVGVCANSSGAFAALRCRPTPRPIRIVGASLAEDMGTTRPWIREEDRGTRLTLMSSSQVSLGDDEDDMALDADVATTGRLCAWLTEKDTHLGRHGADLLINHTDISIPVHFTVLAARSLTLRSLLLGNMKTLHYNDIEITPAKNGSCLSFVGCHPMSILLLLEYIYTDDFPALWDRRVSQPCSEILARLGIIPSVVKAQLEYLAQALDLPVLKASLIATIKRIATPTLARDMARLFREPVSLSANVVLQLADREIPCHAIVLRARSQFFRNFFDDMDWTVNRWPPGGALMVDMKHIDWRTMAFVLSWMCCGDEDGLFDDLKDVDSVSELLDLVFSVMAAASELLLDKLMLICSSVILRYVTLQNVASLLADATFYNALDLVDSLHAYISGNLEAILETHLLDEADPDLIKSLATYIQKQQTDKFPVMRNNLIGVSLLQKHRTWLEMQDIPQPLVRSQRLSKGSPRLSPVGVDKGSRRPRPPTPLSPLSSPAMTATTTIAKTEASKVSQQDEIFSMDEEPMPALNIGQPSSSPTGYTLPSSPWKVAAAQTPTRINMKAIMEEAETGKSPGHQTSPVSRTAESDRAEHTGSMPRSSQKLSQRERRKLQAHTLDEQTDPVTRTSGPTSPWKVSSQQASSSTGPVSSPPRRLPAMPTQSPSGLQKGSPGHKFSKQQPATPASILHVSNVPSNLVSTPVSPTTPAPRRASSEMPAWTKAPVNNASSSKSSGLGLSFVAIQQQQLDQQRQPTVAKRSLREIQQEEQARHDEETFLKWWETEEQRLRIGTENPGQQQVAAKQERGKRRGGGRGNSHGRHNNGSHRRGRNEDPSGQ